MLLLYQVEEDETKQYLKTTLEDDEHFQYNEDKKDDDDMLEYRISIATIYYPRKHLCNNNQNLCVITNGREALSVSSIQAHKKENKPILLKGLLLNESNIQVWLDHYQSVYTTRQQFNIRDKKLGMKMIRDYFKVDDISKLTLLKDNKYNTIRSNDPKQEFTYVKEYRLSNDFIIQWREFTRHPERIMTFSSIEFIYKKE